MKAKLYFCTEQQHRTKQQQKPLNFPAESARAHTRREFIASIFIYKQIHHFSSSEERSSENEHTCHHHRTIQE